MTKYISQLLLLSIVVSVNSVAVAADAAALLTGMAEKISGADRISVTLLIRYDTLQESGQVMEFSERRELTLQRPNKLRVDARQSDGDEGGLVLDGSTITQFSLSDAVYSQLEQPGDVDSTIRYLVGKLGIRFPLARLLVRNLPEELGSQVERVEFVETDFLGDVAVEHIAAVGPSVDSQFWIRPDKLPSRIVLTYKNAPGRPRFRADFIDWSLDPDIEPDTFKYIAPTGAEKVPVVIRRAASSKEVAQ
jgi:hypothetical protein